MIFILGSVSDMTTALLEKKRIWILSTWAGLNPNPQAQIEPIYEKRWCHSGEHGPTWYFAIWFIGHWNVWDTFRSFGIDIHVLVWWSQNISLCNSHADNTEDMFVGHSVWNMNTWLGFNRKHFTVTWPQTSSCFLMPQKYEILQENKRKLVFLFN